MAAKKQSSDQYHHGDLREALIEATDEILREKGVEGFALREAARRAGVSPAAPSHHFGSAAGLLSEVAARGFDELSARLRLTADAETAPETLRRQMFAYVRFASDHPARFRLMFRKDRLDSSSHRLQTAGEGAFSALLEAVALYLDANVSDRHVYTRAVGYWSLVHGFAHLALDGKLNSEGSGGLDTRLLEQVTEIFAP